MKTETETPGRLRILGATVNRAHFLRYLDDEGYSAGVAHDSATLRGHLEEYATQVMARRVGAESITADHNPLWNPPTLTLRAWKDNPSAGAYNVWIVGTYYRADHDDAAIAAAWLDQARVPQPAGQLAS